MWQMACSSWSLPKKNKKSQTECKGRKQLWRKDWDFPPRCRSQPRACWSLWEGRSQVQQQRCLVNRVPSKQLCGFLSELPPTPESSLRVLGFARCPNVPCKRPRPLPPEPFRWQEQKRGKPLLCSCWLEWLCGGGVTYAAQWGTLQNLALWPALGILLPSSSPLQSIGRCSWQFWGTVKGPTCQHSAAIELSATASQSGLFLLGVELRTLRRSSSTE